jgi:two-component system, NtrC family, sensor kinase
LATELAQRVGDLRVSLTETGPAREQLYSTSHRPDVQLLRDRFSQNFDAVQSALNEYCTQLSTTQDDQSLGDSHQEQTTVAKLQDALGEVAELTKLADWPLDPDRVDELNVNLELVQSLTTELPSFLHRRIHDLAHEVRGRYRALIFVTSITTLSALAIFGLFVHLFYRWVFYPLRVLIQGSRYVAAGNFNFRIRLDSHDEMAELAQALNDMTGRFQAIRDDLDRQVQLRTKQIVRSEQLASVGYLAAGVAHEINNPLASIAMCSESLESRLAEIVSEENPQSALIRRYLRMIQTEAFRCKEITEKLLDFSRLGDVQHQPTDLRELTQGVIEMVRHVGKYHAKQIAFASGEPVLALVNAQEIKQVVLNLITNALDALEPSGGLTIDLRKAGEFAELIFIDNGCGMTEEVLEHLFEPFFTRKRSGQGTGLGLSIVYRIVNEHGGQIEAASAGPGRGSQFRLTLPLVEAAASRKENHHRYQAA